MSVESALMPNTGQSTTRLAAQVHILLVPKLQFGNALGVRNSVSLHEETEFPGQPHSQTGVWERGAGSHRENRNREVRILSVATDSCRCSRALVGRVRSDLEIDPLSARPTGPRLQGERR